MSKSLGRFSGEPRQHMIDMDRRVVIGHKTTPHRAKAPRGEGLVVVFEYLAAAVLAVWLVVTGLHALDAMLTPEPAVFIGPDGEYGQP